MSGKASERLRRPMRRRRAMRCQARAPMAAPIEREMERGSHLRMATRRRRPRYSSHSRRVARLVGGGWNWAVNAPQCSQRAGIEREAVIWGTTIVLPHVHWDFILRDYDLA